MNRECKMRFKDDDGQWKEVYPGDVLWPLVCAMAEVHFWHVGTQQWVTLDEADQ